MARPACWPFAIFQWLFLPVWSVPSSILTCVAEQPSSPACLCLRLKAFPRKCVYVHVASVPSSYTSHVTHWHSLYRIYCGHGTSQWRCAHGKERWYALLRRHWRCQGQFPRGRPLPKAIYDFLLPAYTSTCQGLYATAMLFLGAMPALSNGASVRLWSQKPSPLASFQIAKKSGKGLRHYESTYENVLAKF